MPDLVKIDDPTVTTSRIVWIAKSEGDDWGTLPDDSYRDKRFRPNRVCVVVRQSKSQTWADWSQAREHRAGQEPGPEMDYCMGTYQFKGDKPVWARVVEDFAVAAVESAVKAGLTRE